MWFEDLFGFQEENPYQVREELELRDGTITSRVNGRSFGCGRLSTPTLGELREKVEQSGQRGSGRIKLCEVVANVQELHRDPANAGSLYQVASQFNLLEMTGPGVTPEMGVAIYEEDRTQGPACAIACGAGTVYRNYFTDVDGQLGQSADRQIDCLAEVGEALGNAEGQLWAMRNGYCLPTEAGLQQVDDALSRMDEDQLDSLRAQLRIGVHKYVQVTLDGSNHSVSQAFCSAVPVKYSHLPGHLWERFARLVLEASYEATLCAAALKRAEHGNNKVFLTMLGGGAFGNRDEWILSAIERAVTQFADVDLDVVVVSYGRSKPRVLELAQTIHATR